MRFESAHARVVDVETCDFSLMTPRTTPEVLQALQPERWERYLASPTSRALLDELGVERRFLTHVPGERPRPGRLNALDLAASAVRRLRERRPAELAALDAILFVSTSNPNPCNSQAALLAHELGLCASCLDLKAGCSGGVLGMLQAALMIEGGCRRVLIVMAETLSQLTDPGDLRMAVTVGDGAACVLMERCEAPAFRLMVHGSEPEFARTMQVEEPFPPASPAAAYVYRLRETVRVRERLEQRWRELFHEVVTAARVAPSQLRRAWVHQTHAGQVKSLVRSTGLTGLQVPSVVTQHGNMGTPTFAVAMARDFAALERGDPYLLQAVGGGLSWCAILAEHG